MALLPSGDQAPGFAERSISQVTDSLKGVAGNLVDGLLDILGLGNEDKHIKYPTSYKGLDRSVFTNAPDYFKGTWKDSKGYAFDVVRVNPKTQRATPARTGEDKGWKEFRLQINPQELTQDEIFAIEVTPTFRGVVVEHHGTILKDIVISGTTGISPNRGEGGAIKKTGRPVMRSGHSGFQEFHELRSYIRAYVEYKRVDPLTEDLGELRLVFKNLKDSEFLFVEPQKFTMKRSSAKRMLYDYTLTLKGIGVVSGFKEGKDNSTLLGLIGDVLDTASELIEYAAQITNASVGLIRRVESDLTNTLLGPMASVGNALSAIKNGRGQLFGDFGITRRLVESYKSEKRRIESNFNEAIGRDISQWNTATGRTPTVIGASRNSTHDELLILNAFNAWERGLNLILGEKTLFEPSAAITTAQVKGFYTTWRPPTPNSVREETIDGNDTIQSLAAREFGDPDRFKDIVVLNNLKAPYIDPAGGDGVLKPGQKILLPQRINVESTGVKKGKEFNISRQLRESEKNLGIDIRLTKDNDLAISNIKDLDLIGGVTNMAQAILVRLFLEKQSLKRHPTIGTNLIIGEKSVNLEELKSNITESFSSDMRVETIPYIELFQEGNAVTINMIIKLKNLAQPVPLPITLQVA